MASPVLYVLILALRQDVDCSEIFSSPGWCLFIYGALVIGELLFSSVTCLLFFITVQIIERFPTKYPLKTWLIAFTGVLLTFGTFALAAIPFGLFDDKDGLINLMYGNCLCIAWGVWYYTF